MFNMHKLQVELGNRSYPIFIGEHLLTNNDNVFLSYIKGKQVLVVTNETVAPLYLNQLMELLKGYQCHTCILPDGEQYKNWQTLQLIFDALLEAECTRKVTLFALGGGVIGDMAGFAAACYQRGVDFIQVPTTLLSQVDSSIGGKTGINHELGKNMIGAFYQPNEVIIDVTTLKTLPERQLSAGLAEVIKYGLIADSDFFNWLEKHIEDLKALKTSELIKAIEWSCKIKAAVVALDEKEVGLRATLNLGHTFGHAIESHQGYGNWLHGEAVAVGTVMALEMSYRLGWIMADERNRAINLLAKAGLPTVPPANMTVEDFLGYMRVDKKTLEGQIRLVLLKGIGVATVTSEFSAELLSAILSTDYQQLMDSILVSK